MKNRKGFTLIEILVGMLITAVISVCGFEFFRYVKVFSESSETYLKAVNLAREAMEERYFLNNLTPTTGDNDIGLPQSLPSGYMPSTTHRYENIRDSAAGSYRIVDTIVRW